MLSKKFQQAKNEIENGNFHLANILLNEISKMTLTDTSKKLLKKLLAKQPKNFKLDSEKYCISSAVSLSEFDQQDVKPGISIVSCCMNRNDNLKKALATWIKLPVDEIVIVDWSSSEPVSETITDFNDERIKIIRVDNEPRWILTYGFNVGLRFARYSKVFKFDADIQVTSDFLEKNNFLQGEFIRGSWKLASDSGNDEQKFVNGSFGAFKKDLLEVGYYNEFIRTYGYDDSDIYKRLTENAGLSQRFIDTDSILHLDQKEELRLVNQNIAKQQFLDCFNATELYNLINKNISQLYNFWFQNNLQNYSIVKKSDNFWLAGRVTQHVYIPEYVQIDAISYAVIQLLTWKFNAWVWLPCDIKSLAMQLYVDHKRQISFNCSKILLGLDKSLPVFFIGENDFLSGITSIDRDCDVAECYLVSGTGERYEKISSFSKFYTVIGYNKDDYEKLKQLRSDITRERIDCYESVVDENNVRLLATSVYDEKVPHRMQEYLECFERNIAEFDIIALYYEEKNGAFLKRAGEVYRKLDQSGQSLAQVYFINIDFRPTFRSLFDSIDLNFPGVMAFVSNADIAFDETIKLVVDNNLDDVFLVLSRKEVVPKVHTDDGLIMNQFGVPNTFSADVWIYKSPLKYDFKADFPIGSFHCDSFMNFYLGKSNYRLYNPCLSVNCFHIHDPVFNSSEEKEIVLRESIQKKLDEEIIACGGEFPLRGVQWCRISDIKKPNLADMTLMWSDMIVNINLEYDGSNLYAVIIQALIALRINSKVQAGHTVNINMPHAVCHSDIADVIFNFKQFINNHKLTIGVSNSDKNELFVKELPHHQKVKVNTATLISSYKSAI
ncbi:MAG TPA: glycosyltransferase, partial [Pseudomonadales bacterium]